MLPEPSTPTRTSFARRWDTLLPIPGRLAWSLVAGSALGWRIWSVSPTQIWKDIPALFALYFLGGIVGGDSRIKGRVLIIAAVYIVGIYLIGQVPLTLRHLGITP
jgi:hypothetical protein